MGNGRKVVDPTAKKEGRMDGEQKYVVVVDAICGNGSVLRQGKVVSEDQLWGLAPYLLAQQAIRSISDDEVPVPEGIVRSGAYAG